MFQRRKQPFSKIRMQNRLGSADPRPSGPSAALDRAVSVACCGCESHLTECAEERVGGADAGGNKQFPL